MERTWATEVVLKNQKNLRARVIAEREELSVEGAKAYLTVTVYPPAVVRQRGQGGDSLAKKLRVPENQGSISFVRLNREIAYTNVPRIFPRGVEDPDRFIGIEVSFEPDLDEYFGVRNVKRGVEPHGELRDMIRKRLGKYVRDARGELDLLWGEAQRKSKQHRGEHSLLTDAVKAANRTLPKSRAKGPDSAAEHEAALEKLAKDVGVRDQEAEAYKARVRDLPFVVESVDWPGSNFVDIQHLGHQVIIRLNTRHRFYRGGVGATSGGCHELKRDDCRPNEPRGAAGSGGHCLDARRLRQGRIDERESTRTVRRTALVLGYVPGFSDGEGEGRHLTSDGTREEAGVVEDTSVPHFQDHASDNWEPEGAGSDGVVNRSWSGRRSNMLSWSTCSIW